MFKSYLLKILLSILLCCFVQTINSQNANMNLLSHVDIEDTSIDGGSDIWGWTSDDGVEYVFMGEQRGTRIYELSDPSNPLEIAFIPGHYTLWRDIKTYKNFAYITSEYGDYENDGLIIVDLSDLPNNISYHRKRGLYNEGSEISSCHNLYIEETTGFMYLFGCSKYSDGAIIFDLNDDPANPQFVGSYDQAYIHDGIVKGDLLYASQMFLGNLAVIDVSKKYRPVVLGVIETVEKFAHHCWVTDDDKYVFSVDEINGAYIEVFDISDPTDIKFVSRIQSSPGEKVSPHNIFYKDGYLYTSYYTDGVVIYDAKYPDQLGEVARYDTSPNLEGGGFDGCWGVFPYFDSGLIVASDQQEGFFVFGAELSPLSRAKVTVKNENGDLLSNAAVSLLASDIVLEGDGTQTVTNILGEAKLMTKEAGDYQIKVSLLNYTSEVIDIELVAGERPEIEVILKSPEEFTATITVKNESGEILPNVNLEIESQFNKFSGKTNNDGQLITTFLTQGDPVYEVIAGDWGFISEKVELIWESGNQEYEIILEEGYSDDFIFDFGWTESGNAEAGKWIRSIPEEIFTPNADVADDLGKHAFITGAGTGTESEDVDNGNTILTSPIFDLTNYTDLKLYYSFWFTNDSGNPQKTPNDYLITRLHNGDETIIIDTISVEQEEFLDKWVNREIIIEDYFTPSDEMRISFETKDDEQWNNVEAGVDAFRIEGTKTIIEEPDTTNTSIKDLVLSTDLKVSPNPFTDFVMVEIGNYNELTAENNDLDLNVYDLSGKLIKSINANANILKIETNELVAGTYILELKNSISAIKTIKIVKNQ